MSDPDTFTGERFIPGVPGEIAYEHCHRYAFARGVARGRRVLDAACGEGYGAALMADVAASVIGIDIDSGVVSAASKRYAGHPNLRFETSSVTALPIAEASVDLVVSFETIEHIAAGEQVRMLAEFARVLAPGGLLILSSPNRVEYSDARGYVNPFHVHELDRGELEALLAVDFPAQRWFRQRRYLGSAIWAEAKGSRFEVLAGDTTAVRSAEVPLALYFVVAAAHTPAALPADPLALSLYADAGDSEWERIDNETRKIIRMYGELQKCDDEITRQTQRIAALEAEGAEREAKMTELDRHIGTVSESFEAERDGLRRQVATLERIVAYRASLRWWLVLPWLRLRRLLEHIRPA